MLLRIKLPESRKTLIVKMLLIAFSRVLLPPEFIKLPAWRKLEWSVASHQT